ncbi:2-keto-4-pentenoate hydratase/2-oxohepta-3-ene-1,7-dioic acid hydratase in catechol pathway [Planomicrobium koreense]|uniref:2-keto-4-pentenoate hydratase/2-oxohepta-3-ene-1,7-dioic acid hydratase in catechol pathway n=1 Tax=Planococcus koreensis TaxID=112331 RepID=A0A7W8CRD5_9BACL|nr:fumarylacetoacetate hydrolase family protein [Planococcus koreensis]MBB5180270.1 2-keto-4-pentenoate hydratase/2-oxohepta-3-ene-1,7-dioic acid hydratase in catechol pathway [Planococcus koreensis]
MRLAMIQNGQAEQAAIISGGKAAAVAAVNKTYNENWQTNIFGLIESGELDGLTRWFNETGKAAIERGQLLVEDAESLSYGPLYRRPRKIWGIGLNYVDHASDLGEKAPNTEPASFMKPDTSIIGPGDTIEIPLQSERTTAEAELGVIIGKTCRDVEEGDVMPYIAGYTTIIDMTAEDILQKNPRYLTRAKSFDTFFSFGPQFVTKDEIGDLHALEVATVINGTVHRKNTIDHMTFSPEFLVSFHSKVMTLLPGDIISTGTPGAVPIQDGDQVECRIEGFEALANPCADLKASKTANRKEEEF